MNIKEIFTTISPNSRPWKRHDGQPCVSTLVEDNRYSICHYFCQVEDGTTREKVLVRVRNNDTFHIIFDENVDQAAALFQDFKDLYFSAFDACEVILA